MTIIFPNVIPDNLHFMGSLPLLEFMKDYNKKSKKHFTKILSKLKTLGCIVPSTRDLVRIVSHFG